LTTDINESKRSQIDFLHKKIELKDNEKKKDLINEIRGVNSVESIETHLACGFEQFGMKFVVDPAQKSCCRLSWISIDQ
jgi:hypothetical protein